MIARSKKTKTVANKTVVSTIPVATPVASVKKKNERGVIMRLKTTDLMVDHTYQRDLNTSRCAAMIKRSCGWNWRVYSPITVAARTENGHVHFYVVDGQHRLAMAIGCGVAELDCYVIQSESVADEAADFVDKNQTQQHMSAYYEFRAMAESGDPVFTFIKDAFAKVDVNLPDSNGAKPKPFLATCGKTIVSHLRKNKGPMTLQGQKDVLDAILILNSAWRGEAATFSGRMVGGMLRLLPRISDDSRDLLLEYAGTYLAPHDPQEILDIAQDQADHKVGGCGDHRFYTSVLLCQRFNGRRKRNTISLIRQ